MSSGLDQCKRRKLVMSVMKSQRQEKVRNVQLKSIDLVKDSGKVKQPAQWIPELGLMDGDKKILLSPTEWINDNIIDAAQKLMKKANPQMSGLQNVTCGLTMSFNVQVGEFVQIIHDASRSHWVTVSTVGLEHPHVHVFDSLFSQPSESVKMQVACLLYTEKTYISLTHMHVQRQHGGSECGLYSIAFATALVFGHEPGEFQFAQARMRSHLYWSALTRVQFLCSLSSAQGGVLKK